MLLEHCGLSVSIVTKGDCSLLLPNKQFSDEGKFVSTFQSSTYLVTGQLLLSE